VKFFGSSGIRGIINEDIDARLALAVGNSVGHFYKSIVLGHDGRASNEILSNAILAGALFSEAKVVTTGLVPTPTLANAASGYECGIMITASHNPPQYNGIKLWNPDGSSFDTTQMEKIEERILKGTLGVGDWRNIRRIETCENAVSDHIERILSTVEPADIKVVVDCLNGAAGVITPYLLRRMGCEVIAINSDPDRFFHGRTPEPTEENLKVLKDFVKATKADLGIAHDGDADRMVAVDEKGNYVDGGKLLSLFCSIEAVKNVVIPFDASMAIDDSLKHVKVNRCRVGDVYVSETIKKTGADFGGEPSGTFIFPKHSMGPDGIYAAARLVGIVKGNKLSKLISKLPSYPTIKESIQFDPKKKEKIMKAVNKSLDSLKSKRVEKIEGTKLTFKNAWALVRFSGTEPKIRLVVEGRSPQTAKEVHKNVLAAVKRGMRRGR
jgi:phosphoglucosamine mutase